MCKALVMYELHPSYELLEKETSHVLVKAVGCFHSLKELSTRGVLQHNAQMLISQEHLQIQSARISISFRMLCDSLEMRG